ncbi:MAG: cupredoxin domain-containing protein [Syntrophobacteraceae bacterium]|nr:cupredoxin domain-containing protein [Syntrophobacteraceae bacterium]
MRPGSKRSLILIFVMAAALAGCAGGGRIQNAEVRSGSLSVLPIEAGSFYFTPNEICIDKPGPLTIEVNNVSGAQQNFTLKDPKWETLESVAIAAGETARIHVEFCMPGVYQFYCGKTLKSFVGMNGQISVGR